MKKSINLRLAGIAILAIIATTISITLVYYGLFQNQVKSELELTAKLLKDTEYFDTVDTDESVGQDREFDLSTDMDELRVTWVDSDGTVLYDNDVNAASMENHAARPEIQDALATGEGQSTRHSDTLGVDTFYYAILLDNGTVLRVAVEAANIWSVFSTVVPMILLIILAIVVVCVFISHFLTRQLLAPIASMAENIDDTNVNPPYNELVPFSNAIRKQHADILSAAKVRQDFTANVSHELKTPLTAISGYAELIENGMVSGEESIHFAAEIKKNADRLLSLINDIIGLSELDRMDQQDAATTFEPLDLYDLVEENVGNLEINAEKHNIELIFTGDHVNFTGNRGMINEVVENLVQNAIRYNNPGGHVWVQVKDDNGPTLIVKDDGIGIPKDDQSRVFERFYRVDKSRSKETGGTGLGLAIVKHILEIHDAKLELKSELGTGTEIVVRL